MSWLSRAWGHPLVRGLDIDADRAVSVHQRIIGMKPLVRWVYRQWYGDFARAMRETSDLALPVIEIGCGAGHLEQVVPGVLKSDVAVHTNVDVALSAEALPFRDASLRAMFGLGVLHHLGEPLRCLAEAQRYLAKGGRLVLIEPNASALHRFMVRRFHPHEYYDDHVAEPRNVSVGRLSRANNALPWIIFVRDRADFARHFPGLEIRSVRHHTFAAYYLSGGLSYRAFIPPRLEVLVRAVETLVRPLPTLGTMMTVEVART